MFSYTKSISEFFKTLNLWWKKPGLCKWEQQLKSTGEPNNQEKGKQVLNQCYQVETSRQINLDPLNCEYIILLVTQFVEMSVHIKFPSGETL